MKKIQINWKKETKKKAIIALSIVVSVCVVLIMSFYIGNEEFRSFFDRNILRKEVTENKATSIDISKYENPSIYAYDKYITLLNKNALTFYTNSGKKEYELEVSISDALYASNNRFLVVAQKNGQNIYLISEGNIVWQNELDGEIRKIEVNKNGYVSIITAETNYKTVVSTYSPAGKKLFKNYLHSTTAIDTSISNDNKYLAIAEVNTSGTLIQSSIKIISVEKAQTQPENAVIYTYNAQSNSLITSIQYQDRNRLISMYDDGVHSLLDEKDELFISFNENKVTFANVKLNNYSVYTIEKNAGIFSSNTQVNLKNAGSGKENIYTAKGVVKNIKTYEDNIALNLGSEIHFITTNGWLAKKYTSEKEVKDIVLGGKIAGIVYKDKIDIINL